MTNVEQSQSNPEAVGVKYGVPVQTGSSAEQIIPSAIAVIMKTVNSAKALAGRVLNLNDEGFGNRMGIGLVIVVVGFLLSMGPTAPAVLPVAIGFGILASNGLGLAIKNLLAKRTNKPPE